VAWQEQELYPGCCLAWAVFFRRIDANGAPVSPAVRLPIASLAGEQISLAWNGSEYGVVWEQYDRVDFVARIAFQRIDATGTPIGTPKEVTRDPAVGSVGHRVPVLIWRHDQYGLLFLDVRPDGLPRANMFLRLDREGRPLERPRDVSPAPYSEYGYLTADPYGFALAYLYLIDPYFQRLDRFGGLRGAAFQLKNDDFDQGFPQVVATPWGYAFTWTEDSGFPNVVGRIHYQRFDLNGNPQGPAVNLMPTLPGGSANGFPSQLVWLGSEFLFAYHESQGRIRLDRVDPTGGRMGPDVLVVSDTPSTIAYPFLAWNGSRPLVAWSDSRVGGVGHPRSVTSFLTCCEEVAPPVAVSGAGWSDAATFVWSASGAERYDRVRGDLMTLRSLGGDYTPTVLECSNDLLTTSSAETGQPGSLSGWYYLVRGDGVCGEGSYDDPVVQPFTSRDAGINSSASSCP